MLQAHWEGHRSKVEEMEEKVAFTVELSVALSLQIPLLQTQETDSADLVRTYCIPPQTLSCVIVCTKKYTMHYSRSRWLFWPLC